ncbi:SET domain-containing protein [Ophiobolus disseminans]|uniref:SET domain-containing protein n=1 Tax=Ophiobolus disseminans TaxID=1469910 RepID=A0A6A6ZNP6_9PLEO|nr:SET domain-containing protein [Ophiobolus disseminans]
MPSLTTTTTTLILVAASSVLANTALLNIPTLLQHPYSPQHPLSAHAPWSHPPHCTTSHRLPSLNQKFCIFTSKTTGPHGLSLILQPQDAARATEHLDDSPLDTFLTQAQAEKLFGHGSESPWQVVDMGKEGKGMGVKATRRIKKYETFMLDQAALVIAENIDEALPPQTVRKMMRIAVERLRVPGVVRGMSKGGYEGGGEGGGDRGDGEGDVGGKDGDGGGDGGGKDDEGRLEEAIMKTNAFGSTVADVSARTLFPDISRINHACNPNSFVMFSRAGVSMAIKAYRDIEEGEEISISYLLLGIPSAQRATQLQRWGFTCTCALCSLPAPEKQASDLRRVMIAQSEEKIIALAESGNIDEAIALAHEATHLIADEQIHPMLTDEYSMLAMLYLEKGDRAQAEVYGRKAWSLLGDLGFLGTGDSMGEFTLDRLLGGIGGLGGDGEGGSGGKWRRRRE